MRNVSYGIAASVLILSCILIMPVQAAAQPSIGFSVAHGAESSQAYDLSLRHVFEPIYATESIRLSPLVETGISLWEHSAETVWGGNANIGLVLHFFEGKTWRPFIAGTVGLAVLSDDSFDDLDLGCRQQIRSRGSLGVAFGENFHHTLGCDVTHYSNAGMADENDGYSTVGISYSFTF